MEFLPHPRELVAMLWRRKWFFLAPAAFIGLGALAVVLYAPPTYQSEATILIERQEVPEDIVPSLMSDHIDRRLNILTQRITVTDRLFGIAERYDLYPEARKTMTRSNVADIMRGNIETDTVVTEINDGSGGPASQATVAFEIKFSHGDPRIAQQVTNELVSAYLSGNLETRRSVAEETTRFFANGRDALDRRIAAIEEELTRFKTENREILPEEAAFKRELLTNLAQELRSLEGDLRTLRERESFLATQLALNDEFAPTAAGVPGSTPESQLELVRAELATARARYSSGHPDVVRLQREVRSLQQVVGGRSGGGSAALVEREGALSAELAGLEERYTDEHPDVRRVRRELESLRGALADGGGGGRGGTRNPAYVELSAQLNSVEAEIGAVEQQREDLREERRTLQEQLARAPAVEREFTRLNRQLESAIADRDALAEKETTVKLSGSLETAAVGEQLVLMEPPTLPTAPASPNKKLILALGLVLAVGSGGASVMLAELLDRTIRSVGDLARIVGDTPLAAVPIIASASDRRRRRLRLWAAAVAALAVLAATLTWLHFTTVPLDVLSSATGNKIQQWVPVILPDLVGDVLAAGPE